MWQFEIDHRGQVFDVEAAGGHVGGHQHADLARLEVLQCFGTRLLGLVAVDGVGRDAMALRKWARRLQPNLVSTKTSTWLASSSWRMVGQQVALQAAGNRMTMWSMVSLTMLRRATSISCGFFSIWSASFDFVREGGREQQALADSRQQRDAADVGDEAHVEHAVGFVEDRNLDLAEGDGFAGRGRAGGPAWR